MTDREELIELLLGSEKSADEHGLWNCFASPAKAEFMADYLLANGVTFAKDTDVPSKWISVEDPPGLFRGVNVWCPEHRNTFAAYLNARGEWYTFDPTAAGMKIVEKVTHWMPMPEGPTMKKEDH